MAEQKRWSYYLLSSVYAFTGIVKAHPGIAEHIDLSSSSLSHHVWNDNTCEIQCPYGQQLQSKYSHSSNLLREQQSNQQCSEYGKNKTPGPDGLHEEFTVTFLDTVIDDLCQDNKYILSSKLMPKSMSEVLTILLPKGGDPSSPDKKGLYPYLMVE